MKKLLSLLLLFFAFQSVDAQSVVKEGGEYECICEVFMGLGYSAYILTPFDYDYEAKQISNADGSHVVFKSWRDLLLYMGKRGWSFMGKGVAKLRESTLFDLDTDSFILKKTVVNDSEILQDLFLVKDEKKGKKGK